MAVDLPTGLVSFVFTDIEGSTHLLRQLGDEVYAEVLAEHCALLRDALTHTGGREFGNEGDALFFVFEAASTAIAGSLAAQQALLGKQWPLDANLRVRIGIHSGEASLTSDGTYVGLPLHLAARICSAARGGQVVLSDAAREYAGRFPDGAASIELGLHRLRDFPEPLRLHQLTHPDLPSKFARLRSDAAPGNLPKQMTSFVGRATEVEAASRLLADGCALVTLTGPGGAGKTRLALEVASEVVDEYPHGAWIVELASVSEADLVAQGVATALDLRDEPGRTIAETLAETLRSRRLLLVLDNCEHLVSACAALASSLLRSCPGVQIVATSQEALGVTGETVIRVPALTVPEGVQLFADRAAQHRPGFVLDPTTTEAATQIYRRLDGIPLAIELAAARVNVLSPQQIAARLDDQFRLLTGGNRTALPRQRTLRAAVDWSYSLLSDDERALLRRVSVFAGGFGLDAVEAVVAGEGIDPDDVLELLARLVARSLVVVEEQDGEAHYRLLETIRQYAQEKLAEADEIAALRSRHLDCFHHVVLTAEPELSGADQAAWLRRLDRDYENIRAAMEWAAGHPAGGDVLLAMTASLWRFWLVRGHWGEGRSWLGRALAANPDDRSSTRARALAAAGDLATEQADNEAAQPLLDECYELWKELGEPEGIAKALNHLGNLARARFEFDSARGLLTDALAMRRDNNNDRGLAVSLRNLGLLAALQRDWETARSLYAEALPLARAMGDKRVVATLTHALATVSFADGDREGATVLAAEGVDLARELGDRQLIAEHLTILSGIRASEGDETGATALLDEALVIWQALGSRDALAWSHTTLGEMAAAAGDPVRALDHAEQALSAWRRVGDDTAVARVTILAAQSSYLLGDLELAATRFEEAIEVTGRVGDDAQRSAALQGLGDTMRLRGDAAFAHRLYDQSLELANSTGWKRLLPGPILGLGVLARERGDLIQALELLRQSIALRPRFGRSFGIAQCLDEIAVVALEAGDADRATRLLASAAAWRQDAGGALPPVREPDYNDLLARIRSQLGEDNFKLAWKAGSVLSGDEAIALASDPALLSG